VVMWRNSSQEAVLLSSVHVDILQNMMAPPPFPGLSLSCASFFLYPLLTLHRIILLLKRSHAYVPVARTAPGEKYLRHLSAQPLPHNQGQISQMLTNRKEKIIGLLSLEGGLGGRRESADCGNLQTITCRYFLSPESV
jgi:hypothetical protein